ncbi:MAG: hypothetical protein PUD15_08650 [Prevotella sp.]|nr:hypothetical protein [Prevotella sp.]
MEKKEIDLTTEEMVYEQIQKPLKEMLADGKITKLDYLLHNDDDLRDGYLEWCADNGLDSQKEESAEQYLEEIINAEEDDLSSMPTVEFPDEEPTSKDPRGSAMVLYDHWNLYQTDKVREMSHSREAAVVTCWRYKNPMSTDKEQCAMDTALDKAIVEKWWDVADYIYGANGCMPVTPIDDSVETMEAIIKNFSKFKQ